MLTQYSYVKRQASATGDDLYLELETQEIAEETSEAIHHAYDTGNRRAQSLDTWDQCLELTLAINAAWPKLSTMSNGRVLRTLSSRS